MKIKFNLFALKRQLELRTGKAYAWDAMAKGIGVHRNTIFNLANNRTERVDLSIMAGMIEYFNKEGLPVEISDLFVVDDST